MTRLNPQLQQRNLMRAQPYGLDIGIFDGMAAAAEQTARSLPTASLVRGIQNTLDTSENIDPIEANTTYNLQGESAFTEGEEVTIAMAEARQKDQSFLARTDTIQNIVNEDSPILGHVTQFAAGMAVGFVDPISFATGLGVSAGLARGARAVLSNRAVMGKVAELSPRMGTWMVEAYASKASQSLTTHLVREGTENFLGTVAEETINFAGIGEDRLARKVTYDESLMNIVIGTSFGTALGMGLNKGARHAVARKLKRDYGDSAPDFAKVDSMVRSIESQAGMPLVGDLHMRAMDREVFETRPWHQQIGDNDVPAYYAAIDGDTNLVSFSGRDGGFVFTNNLTQAQNKGAKVNEMDISQLNILSQEQFAGVAGTRRIRPRVVGVIADNMLDNLDEGQLQVIAQKTTGAELPAEMLAKKGTRDQLKRSVKEQMMQMEDIDSLLNLVDSYATGLGKDIPANKIVGGVLEDLGFDGYTFKGKNFSGQNAYEGLFVNNKSLSKVKASKQWDVPQPSALEKIEWKVGEKEMLEGHARYVDSLAEMMEKQKNEAIIGKQQEEQVPEVAETAQLNPDQKKYVQERGQALRDKQEAGERLTADEEEDLKILEIIEQKRNLDDLTEEELGFVDKYVECRLGK